jgi:hypothetical protein
MRQTIITLNLVLFYSLTINYLLAQNKSPFGIDGKYISIHTGLNNTRLKAGKDI